MISPTIEPVAIADAARALAAGHLVIFPTDTVYGLGADATNPAAVERLYIAKGRPASKPLIWLVADLESAMSLARFSPAALALAREFWPGPLTLVLPTETGTLALRVEGHPIVRQLLREVRRPIVAPSANLSGAPAPRSLAEVSPDIRSAAAVTLDGGPTTYGTESTIVSCIGVPRLLREGVITRDLLRV